MIRVVCTAKQGWLAYHYPDRPPEDRFGRWLTGITAGGDELYEVVMADGVFGRHHHDGPIGRTLDTEDGAQLRAEKLAERVHLCRQWVAECAAKDAALTGDVTVALGAAEGALAALESGRRLMVVRADGTAVEI